MSNTNNPRRWILMFALTLIMFLINVDYLAVNLALVPMAHDLHSNLNTLQWILSGYVLAWAILVIPAGRYMEKFTKKQACLLGLGLFLFASLLAGMAQSDWVLIIARLLQGGSGAVCAPSIYALIFLNFAENERGRAMGMMTLGVGLGMAIGPFVGGLLLAIFDWRSIFYINLPIGLASMALIYVSANAETHPTASIKIDKLSTLLLSMSLVAALYAIGAWQVWAINPTFFLGLALIGLGAMTLFIRLQIKSESPLIPFALFKNLSFTACCVGMALEQYVFSAIVVSTGIYLQKVMQYSSFQSSLVFLSLTIVFGLIAMVGGPWVDRVGLKKPIVLGLSILALSVLAFSFVSSLHSTGLVCGVLILMGCGMGLAFLSLNTGAVKTTPAEYVSVASSVFLLSALLGNAFGVTMTTMFYERASLQHLFSYFTTDLSAMHIQQIIQFLANIGSNVYDFSLFDQASQTMIIHHLPAAMSHGISHVMLISAAVCLAAVMFCGLALKSNTLEAEK